MKNRLQQLQDTVRALALSEGGNETEIPCLTVWRFTTSKIRMPQTENPYLYLVLDGALRLHTPSGMLDYMAGQYSISGIDMPLRGTALTVSEKGDFLAVSLEFTANDVITTVLEMDNNDLAARMAGGTLTEQEMTMSDGAVILSVARFFSLEEQTVPSEFLRKHMLREVIYDVLCGSAESSFCRVLRGLDGQRKYMRPTAGLRRTSEIPSRWRAWRSGKI